MSTYEGIMLLLTIVSLVASILDINWGKVNLFIRPRRFGKSMNMSMLKAFFEIGTDKSVFEGLAISKETSLCEEYMGRYPVISITLKHGGNTNEEKESFYHAMILGICRARRGWRVKSSSSAITTCVKHRAMRGSGCWVKALQGRNMQRNSPE